MHPRRVQDREQRARTPVDAICATCGVACKVPFKPREGRPVLCKRCFDAVPKEPGAEGRAPAPPPKPAFPQHVVKVALAITCVRCGEQETVTHAPKKRERAMCRACCMHVFGPGWEGWKRDSNPPFLDQTCRGCGATFEVPPSDDPPLLCRSCFTGFATPQPERVEGGSVLDSNAGVKRKRMVPPVR